MARALYRDADIYLLDDPLSAVDVKVSKDLFKKYVDSRQQNKIYRRVRISDIGFCRSIKQFLGNKICILVTHQVQFLQEATTIIILNNV